MRMIFKEIFMNFSWGLELNSKVKGQKSTLETQSSKLKAQN
jgi:hypothetical protein